MCDNLLCMSIFVVDYVIILVIVSLRQFWVNDVWTLPGQESPLMNKKELSFLVLTPLPAKD
jgi:hypothetical protein